MSLLSHAALLLVALTAYAGGAVAGARGEHRLPSALDLLLSLAAAVACVALLADRPFWLRLPLTLLLASLAGWLSSLAARPERGEIRIESADGEAAGLSHRVGAFQALLLMGLLSLVVVTPFAIALRARDALAGRRRPAASLWRERDAPPATLAEARKQG